MALINAALERRIPIFAICGLQELVVATGGTLYRRLFEQPELLEHREDPELPVEQQYAVPSGSGSGRRIAVSINTGLQHVLGKLATWARGKTSSPQLRVEAARMAGGSGQRSIILSRWAYSGILNGTVANTPCRVCCLMVLSPPVSHHAEKRRR
jgi:gamma-glutamyl-gamma-aminobutyrate hydrolase